MVAFISVLIWLPDSSVKIPILVSIMFLHDYNKHFYWVFFPISVSVEFLHTSNSTMKKLNVLIVVNKQWIACVQAVFFFYYRNTEKYAHMVNLLSTLSVYILHFLALNCTSSMLCASSLMCIYIIFQLSPDLLFPHRYIVWLLMQSVWWSARGMFCWLFVCTSEQGDINGHDTVGSTGK